MLRALALVAVLAAPAAAEPSAQIHDNAPFSVMLGATIGGIEIGPVPMGENGLGGEVAFGAGRWQLLGEVGVGRAHLDEIDVHGWRTRVGLGARWIARAFHMDAHGGPEMVLEASLGMDRVTWDEGGTIERPDLSFGWATQMRYVGRRHQGGMRFGVRVFVSLAPDDDVVARVVCRGTCPEGGDDGPVDDGFMGYFAGFWGG